VSAKLIHVLRTCRGSLLVTPLFLVTCAKVGDPLPPLVDFPDPVAIRLVQQARDQVEVLITSSLEDVEELEVYRECGASLPTEFSGSLLASYKVESIGRDVFVIQDPEPSFEVPCRYQVRVRNDQGRRSQPSITLETVLISPPNAPVNLDAEVQESQIILSWEAPMANLDGSKPPNIVGYLVNSVHFVSGTEFIDREAVFGKEVTYSVQSVGNLKQPTVLSRPSQQIRIVPEDRFPPAVPRNLTAVPIDSKVQLLWDAVSDKELAGYFVYRGENSEELKKLSPLITINRYVDPQPFLGSTSFYAVAAVDNSGNESLQSDVVTVNVNP
jgi:hypothetical protein